MARRKRQTQALDATSTEALVGPPTDDVCIEALNKVQEAWRVKEIKKEEAQEANGRYRAAIKDAKAKGLNSDSILDVVRIWQKDPDDVTQRWSDNLRYARLLGMPIGSQGELWAEPSRFGEAPYELGLQKVAGRKRVGARSMAKQNPYPTGGWQAREFERGWQEGAKA